MFTNSILRFAAAKKLGTGFARTSQQPFRSQALRARHLLRGSSVCAILGPRSFGRILAGEHSLHASSVACSPMCSRPAQSHVQQTGASSSAAPGSVLKFEKAAEGNQQLDRCEPQERRGVSPDHSASSKVHSGFVCHGRCGGRGRVCWRQVGRRWASWTVRRQVWLTLDGLEALMRETGGWPGSRAPKRRWRKP